MCSHVCFGSTFTSNPRSKITWSISYSAICVVNHISLPIRNVCFPSFWNTRISPDLAHLVISSCNPFTALLSRSNFIHVSRKVVIIEESISGSSWSLLPEVEASVKLFLASMNVSFAKSRSNSGSFVGAFWTHALSSGCLPLSYLVMILLLRIMFNSSPLDVAHTS